MYFLIKRIFDLVLSSMALLILFPVLLTLWILCRLTDRGPFLHWSKRVGVHSKIFLMPKIRTMRLDTPQVATHLLQDGKNYLTPMGAFLRKSSLDELPQLFSILAGDMSFVGPRPALFNQDDLIALRQQHQIDQLPPGLTGWAQINGRDEISIQDKVNFEKEYFEKKSFLLDCKIIFWTFIKVFKQEDIKH